MFNCSIEMSDGDYGGIMQVHYSSIVSLFNCTFSKNLASSTLFEIIDSIFVANNVSFFNNFNNLIDCFSSLIYFHNITINSHECSRDFEGCIAILFDSRTQMENVLVVNVSSIHKNNILLSNSKFTSFNLKFLNTSANLRVGACISGINTKLIIENSYFYYFTGNAIYFENSNINIINSIIRNNDYKYSKSSKNNLYSSFVCFECENITIEQSIFSDNSNVINGGAIYLSNKILFNENYFLKKIINCTFLRNFAFQNGGALFLMNQFVFIDSCNFSFNEAGYGGGIFVENKYFGNSLLPANSTFCIFNCKFNLNFAFFDGGAIKWIEIMPKISENRFINNDAIYGKDVASSPIRLKLNIYEIKENELHILYSSQENITKAILGNVNSGKPIPYILNFSLIDIYGESVTTVSRLVFSFFKK